MDELDKFWSKINLQKKPYIHPADSSILEKHSVSFKSFENYFSSDYWNNKNSFHTDLIPVPFAGDIYKAKIYILLLNPGFSPVNYLEEEKKSFKDALINNILLRGRLDESYPFLYLNPKYLWTQGGQYWLNKFKSYIPIIVEAFTCSEIEALSFISRRVAILQLNPYHSYNFKFNSQLQSIVSSNKIVEFVHKNIIPKTNNNNCLAICTRASKAWGLEEQKNVIVYNSSESRGAHISLNSRSGSKLKEFLLK